VLVKPVMGGRPFWRVALDAKAKTQRGRSAHMGLLGPRLFATLSHTLVSKVHLQQAQPARTTDAGMDADKMHSSAFAAGKCLQNRVRTRASTL